MDSIEGIKIECDEDGFHLILEGDFVDTFKRYLANDSDGSIEVRLPQDVALKLANIETVQIREWWAEGLAAAAYVEGVRELSAMVDDDDCGYDLDDPKHPTYHDRMTGAVDHWPKWNTEAVEDAAKKELEQLNQRFREQRADWINPPGRKT